MDIPEPYETSPEDLDRVWRNYLTLQGNEPTWWSQRNYVVSRQSNTARKFEDWLYEYGARVIQKDRKRFIRFYSSDHAVIFMLQFG